jgi:hypothetical protein
MTAALQVFAAEPALKMDRHFADMRVVSSDANARQLKLGYKKAVVVDLPIDIKEVLDIDGSDLPAEHTRHGLDCLRALHRIPGVRGGSGRYRRCLLYDWREPNQRANRPAAGRLSDAGRAGRACRSIRQQPVCTLSWD